MTTKKTPASNPEIRSAAIPQPSLSHRLDALLHTMRCITQYEDTLCELSHELKRPKAFSEVSNNKLREILDKIPSHDYLMDLDMLRGLLAMPRPPKRSRPKKAAKTSTARKNSTSPKAKSRRKSSRSQAGM